MEEIEDKINEIEKRVKETSKELEKLEKEKENLIFEKVRLKYTNTFWKRNLEFFKIIEVKEIFLNSKKFKCNTIDFTIDDAGIYYEVGDSTFGWGNEYSWEPSTKEELLSAINNNVEKFESLI